MMTPKF